jgi:hypothetical protein
MNKGAIAGCTMNRPQKLNEVIFGLLILGIFLVFIIFLVERASVASLTIDEAATYLNYLDAHPMAMFSFNSANNHLINTLLAKSFGVLAGTSEFVLRLPNLLAYAAYFLFSFLILHRVIKNKLLVIPGCLLLSLNPYVLDFFSLCRGYGLSLAFMMAALFFFFAFLDSPLDDSSGRARRLRFSLAAAILAVLCNFSLLNVYLSLALIAFALFAVHGARGRRTSSNLQQADRPRRKLALPAIGILAAVLFNLLVFSQDLTLADKFFEPVTIRITGLNEEDKQHFDVFRLDIKNQERRLVYEGDIWKMDKPAYFKAIKFRCRPDLLNKIKEVEIRIGAKRFLMDAGEMKRAYSLHHKRYAVFYSNYSLSLKRSRIPIFRPVMNWKGDSAFLPIFFLRALLVLGIFVVAGALLYLLGRFLTRRNILTSGQFRLLASMTLLAAAFTGYPLYILKRSGELYWGGRTGFLHDTVFSLINNSFYGNLYFRGQEWVVFVFVCIILIGFSILIFLHFRKRSLGEVLPGLSVFANLILVSLSTILQRVLFDNPYLIGRTGLFLIPLFTLLLLFLFRELARGKAALKVISISLLWVIACLGIYHFVERANTAMTVEWRSDADIKSLLEDLKTRKNLDFPERPRISLGIDDIFYPSLAYYLKRGASAWLEVDTVPPYAGYDFYYLEDAFESTRRILSQLILIKTYPLSGNLLTKLKGE